MNFLNKKNPTVISGLLAACNYDLCALEGQLSKQNSYKCSIYTTLTKNCFDFAYSKNIVMNLSGWRDLVNCRKIFRNLSFYQNF